MSNLPSVKRYYDEDYKEAQPWFHRFLSQLNLYTEPVYNILNQGVDVSLNSTEEIYILQVRNSSSIGASNAYTFSPLKFVGQPHGITLGQCLLNGTTATIASVTMSWIWTGSQVSIKSIYGLSDGLNYTITLRIW